MGQLQQGPSHESNADTLVCGTWNTRSLTDLKLKQVIAHLKLHDLGILCLQETHQSFSDAYVTEDGFLLVFSGSNVDKREFAGVGFLIRPSTRKSIVGFV